MKDPIAWRVDEVDLQYRMIGNRIETLKAQIEKAQAEIKKLESKQDVAAKHLARVEAARDKLRDGDKIPATLLPTPADIRAAAKHIARMLRASTDDAAKRFKVADFEGWSAQSPMIGPKKITVVITRDKSDDKKNLLKKITLPDLPEGFSLQSCTIDSGGRVSAKLVKIEQNDAFEIDEIAKNIKAAIDAFKDALRDGKEKTAAVALGIKALLERQRANESPAMTRIWNTILAPP